ncbi:MAG TPA: pseudouridine synthase [Gemmatimonadaceae bacterium]|nr:pseudouridine synthase [Gemmatimonadaceae bacterium]
MRIQRALARAGVASRRAAEEIVAAGRVTVNGVPAQIGQSVDPATDDISVDGVTVSQPDGVQWIVLHKPAGVMTTKADPGGRRTVFEFVPPIPGLTYAGRLDYLTEGVLLMTNDGAAIHGLLHPSREVERTYVATVTGDAPRAAAEARRGVMLPDGLVRLTDATARRVGEGRWEFTVTITEGRNREVRRLCKALGLFVERLVRVKFGPVALGALAVGEWRPLAAKEIDVLNALAGSRRLEPHGTP